MMLILQKRKIVISKKVERHENEWWDRHDQAYGLEAVREEESGLHDWLIFQQDMVNITKSQVNFT